MRFEFAAASRILFGEGVLSELGLRKEKLEEAAVAAVEAAAS